MAAKQEEGGSGTDKSGEARGGLLRAGEAQSEGDGTQQSRVRTHVVPCNLLCVCF
jgi:hypothetical protein